ncbi:DUF2085 domain-containing protein [bacterium]|nr:DUF2085 domain-containing protein [bacterium]
MVNNRSDFSSFTEDKVFLTCWIAFLALMLIFFSGIFIAPILVRLGADRIAEVLYKIYRISCHQLPSRSWLVCGNKMGVCVRCFSIYLFLIISGFALLFKGIRIWLLQKRFLRFVLPVFILLLSPLLIDGFIQLFTSWESNNFLRFLTGAFSGIGTSFILGYLVLRVANSN